MGQDVRKSNFFFFSYYKSKEVQLSLVKKRLIINAEILREKNSQACKLLTPVH